MTMKTSPNGLSFIQKHEGLRLKAYLCSANVWTIGWGHTSGVKKGDTCTKEQAVAFLATDIKSFETSVNRLVTVELTQNQFDALISFTFNLGAGALQTSTLLKKVNAKDFAGAADEFLKWDNITVTKKDKDGKLIKVKQEEPGLVTRRKAERELFLAK